MNEITHKSGKLVGRQLDFILLDGSGSMIDKWNDTMNALQAYIDTVASNNINTQVMLSTFDSSNPDCVQRDVPITEWKSLRSEPIGSYWGSTPLYDAILMMGARLRDLDPSRCSIVIVTDGGENGSKFSSLMQAKAILDWCRAKGWQITFIGANFSNSQQARMLGADEATAIGVSQARLSDATKALGEKRAKYGLYGTEMHYSDDEKEQFGGFLNGPSQS